MGQRIYGTGTGLKQYRSAVLFTISSLLIFFVLSEQLIGQSSNTSPNMYSPVITDTYNNLTVTNAAPGLTNWSNPGNLTDSDLTNFAEWSYLATLAGTAWIQVTDNNAAGGNIHPAGSYVGFVVGTGGLLDLAVIPTVRVSIFSGGVEMEFVEYTSLASLLDAVELLGDGSIGRIGFVTTEDFDAIRITFTITLGAAGSQEVYYAEVLRPGDSPQLVCNTSTALVQDDFAAIIETSRTGPGGAATVGTVSNTENVVSDDLDAPGAIELLASVGGSGSISVRDIGQSYDGGHFVGFEISSATLLTGDLDLLLNLLNSITIETYLEDVFRESQSGGDNLVLAVSLLNATDRHTVGFLTSLGFDEVRITLDQEALADVDLGITNVYHAVITQFCEQAFECGGNILNNPDFPVVVNSQLSGLACVGCSVENESNLISENTSDFATIELLAGVAGTVSVSVKNVIDSYPAGTTAGFVIEHIGPLLVDADLLENLEVCTYLDESQQECVSGFDLLRLTLLLPLIGSLPDGLQSVGFVTTMEYDEIRLSVGSLVGALRQIRVYNAFIESYDEDGDGNPCPPVTITLTGSECYRTLSSPVMGLTYADMMNLEGGGTLWTQGITGSDFPAGEPNLFLWPVDEPGDENTGWAPLGNMSAEIPVGTGFLMSVFHLNDYNDPNSGGFDKIIKIPVGPQPGSFTLFGANMNQNTDGWTLLGNPFQFNIDVENLTTNDLAGAFYVYDRNTDAWVSSSAGAGDLEGNAVAIGQGFFVQTDGSNPSVTFSDASRTDNGQFYGKRQNLRDFVRLELSGEGLKNSAWVRFSDQGFAAGRIYGDALQLLPFQTEYAILSSQKVDYDGRELLLDISHFPMPMQGEDITIPLHMQVTKPGIYTIAATDLDLPAGMAFFLEDRETVESHLINDRLEYTFTVSQAVAAKWTSPAGGMGSCFDASLTRAKTVASQPRFYITTTEGSGASELPSAVNLAQNYPNPFNPVTMIKFELPQSSEVTLKVFDVTGRRITTLVEGTVQAGTHTVSFDARNLSSGVYIYTLQVGDVMLNRKLTLIK